METSDKVIEMKAKADRLADHAQSAADKAHRAAGKTPSAADEIDEEQE